MLVKGESLSCFFIYLTASIFLSILFTATSLFVHIHFTILIKCLAIPKFSIYLHI